MAGAASLALLKGGDAKSKTDTELEKNQAGEGQAKAEPKGKVTVTTKKAEPAKEPETEATVSETVDPDKMDMAEIDGLVEDGKVGDVPVPGEWGQMDLVAKRKWLNETFSDAGTDQQTPVADATETKAEETKAEPKSKKGSTKKADAKKAEAKGEEPKAEQKVETEPSKEVATTKKASTPKAVKVLTGEVLGPDAISDIVQEIENLTEKQAKQAVGLLTEATDLNEFKLGGVLSKVAQSKWYEPHASMREYIENETAVGYRKGMYLIGVYNDLVKSGVPYDKVKHLGWTKLKEIARVLTKENMDEWIAIAEKQNTTTLIETVKNAVKAKAGNPALTDETSKTVTTKTFKVHDDQKATIEAAIAKAKETVGTTVDTVALEAICLDYLGGTTKGIKDQLQKAGLEKALEMFAEAYPNVNLNAEVVEAA